MPVYISLYNILKKTNKKFKNIIKLKDNMMNDKGANKIFESINKDLSPRYNGKIVAIDTNSGDYFIGDSTLDAYKKAIKKHPKTQFAFKRIGIKIPYLVGAF